MKHSRRHYELSQHFSFYQLIFHLFYWTRIDHCMAWSLTQYLFENWLMWLWWMNLKLLMLLLMVNFSGPLCLWQCFFCFAFISINPRTTMWLSQQSNVTSHYIWWKQYKGENSKESVYRKNPESVEYLIGGIVGILVRLNRRLSEGKSVIDWPFTISSYKA